MRTPTALLLLSLSCLLSACSESTEAVVFEAELGDQGAAWTTLLADFPEAQLDDVEHVTEVRTIELGDGGSATGIYQYGDNISDDLFMALWRTVDGLEGAGGRFDVEVELATNSSGGCDLGGGANVLVKVGLLDGEATTMVDDQGWVRTAFEHGQQSDVIPTFPSLGSLENDRADCPVEAPWELVTLRTETPIELAPSDGALELFLATESAFESPHEVLFVRVALIAAE